MNFIGRIFFFFFLNRRLFQLCTFKCAFINQILLSLSVTMCNFLLLAGNRSAAGAGESGVRRGGRKVSIRMKARRTLIPQSLLQTPRRLRRWQ